MKKTLMILALALCALAASACNNGLAKPAATQDVPASDSTSSTAAPATVSDCEKALTKCEALVDNDKARKLLECSDNSPCKSEIEAQAVTDKAKCGEAKAKCINTVACAAAKKAAAKACVDCDGKKAPAASKAKAKAAAKATAGCTECPVADGKKGDCTIEGVPNPTEAQCKKFAADAAELDAAIKDGEDAAAAGAKEMETVD